MGESLPPHRHLKKTPEHALKTNQPTPQPAHPPRVGFAFSTMERTELSRRSLASIDTESGFDLVWVDGSKSAAGKQLPREVRLHNCRLVETHYDVRGGPDRAIRYSLRRLLSLGYDYCGLIENDIEFEPGWFGHLMATFERAKQAGLQAGAATARNIGSRVLEHRDGFTLNWNMGAGMVLFTRQAAWEVLADYGLTSSRKVSAFYREQVGYSLDEVWELWMDKPDRDLGTDWNYAASLYQKNLVSIGTVPSVARNIDMDVETACRTKYVTPEAAGHDKPRLKTAVDFTRLFPPSRPASPTKNGKYLFDPLLFKFLRRPPRDQPSRLRQKLIRYLSR
jgi:hypothetical protein